LIELLVVIVILTTIVAAAIPLISPSNDDRRLREAARGLNTYVTGAQTRAIATNRPWGVAFKRLSKDTKHNIPADQLNDNGVSLEAFYVEQQPPYAGFDANSRACVAIHPNPPANIPNAVIIRFITRGTAFTRTADGLPEGWDADFFPPRTIRPHDVIEINGTRFELLPDKDNSVTNFASDAITNTFYEDTDPNSNDKRPVKIIAQPLNNSGQQINPRCDQEGYTLGAGREPSPPAPAKPEPPYWTLPAPYKIYRQPTPAADEPYQLPEGTAIDLRASGVGSGDYFYVPGIHDNDQNVVVMFAPEGRVSKVNFNQAPLSTDDYNQSVVENVYLLVGRRENIGTMTLKEDQTLQSGWPAVPEDDRNRARQKLNWMLGNSRWIVVGSQSGRIVTEELTTVDPAAIFDKYTTTPYNFGAGSEELRNQQILSAREFTREMSQVGGK
jgi:type II secretory pathway pseudopilin PulG